MCILRDGLQKLALETSLPQALREAGCSEAWGISGACLSCALARRARNTELPWRPAERWLLVTPCLLVAQAISAISCRFHCNRDDVVVTIATTGDAAALAKG